VKRRNIAPMIVAGGIALMLFFGAAHAETNQANIQFQVTQRYPLSGTDHWDYVAYDAVRQHLFISRDSHVQVIDTQTGKLFGEIANTNGVHGFAFVQDRKLGFITNGRANTIAVVNLDTLKLVDTINAGGSGPDGILYVPQLQRIYVSNSHDDSVSAIDVATRKLVATIPVGGKPEALAADNTGRVFVNVEDKGEIVALDSKSNSVLAHWPIAPCEEPTGLAIDAASERLFTVCANQRMMVIDANSGRHVAELPIGEHPDAAAFDPVLKTAFSSNGQDGTLTVVHEDDAEHFTVLQNLQTQAGAKTMALDDTTHSVYLVSSKFSPAKPASADHPHPRQEIIPGTFEVLIAQRK